MSKERTPAENMLNELRVIPKLIEQLKLDIEATRSAVLTSPQWSDMKVQGGLRKSQEDKNIAIIDVFDYNVQQINQLMARKIEIMNILMTIPDMLQRHVLITTYANCGNFDEAMDKLGMTRNNYYLLKRKGVETLNLILKNTD